MEKFYDEILLKERCKGTLHNGRMSELKNLIFAFKTKSVSHLLINSELNKMEESFQKDISGYNCKFLLDK